MGSKKVWLGKLAFAFALMELFPWGMCFQLCDFRICDLAGLSNSRINWDHTCTDRLHLNAAHFSQLTLTFSYPMHSVHSAPLTSLSPKALFTPSIQPNLGLPLHLFPSTSEITTFLAIHLSSILSTCPNHISTCVSNYAISESVTSQIDQILA